MIQSEPPRLLASGSKAARTLLRAAKQDAPPPSLAPALLATLGLVAAGAVAPSVGTKLLGLLKQALVSKVSVGVIAVATAGGGGYVVGRLHERSLQPAAVASAIAVPAPIASVAPVLRPIRVVQAAAPAAIASDAAKPVHHKVAVTVASAPEPAGTTSARASLTEELDSVRHIRSLVVAGDGQGALTALDAYDVEHPSGTFAEEALALRVRACRLTGDYIGAERSLRALETQFPGSVHLAGLK